MIKKILLGFILCLFLGGLWFIPWTPVLHLGFLIYFPYDADKSRFISFAGPGASFVGLADWEEQVPPSCLKALVASEDTTFAEHEGIDWKSFNDALEYNKKHQKKRGASTLTQQLVKNAFLSRSQSYLRKSREMVGATLLDKHMSKKDQLLWYWNLVEFGPKIYGITKASRYYFKKEPSKLSSKECSALVALLPSPLSWGKSVQKKQWSSFIHSRISVIEKRIRIMDWAFLENNSLKSSKSPKDTPTISTKPKKPQELPAFKEPTLKDEEKSLEEEDVQEILSLEEETSLKDTEIKEEEIKEEEIKEEEIKEEESKEEETQENNTFEDIPQEEMEKKNTEDEHVDDESSTLKKETFEN